MPDIVLTTFNARYSHCAFGLRYLLANLGELRARATLVEFDLQRDPLEAAATLLAHEPRLVGLGVYIWNVNQATALVGILKQLRPELIVVLGGPEVSYEGERQEIVRLADYVVTGEGDLAFADLCRQVLAGSRPTAKIIAAPPPDLAHVIRPYELYTDDDIAHRMVYVESSRGCAFGCEFCLSSLDVPVRHFPRAGFLADLDRLLARGVRTFKFVDRTFNLNLPAARAILEFFLARWRAGLFLHLELIPDRLPAELRELIRQFPPGALQFEIGIQTFNEEVAARIARRQDNTAAEANLRWLRGETGAHLHVDLIAGLPGESLASFAAGFDRLVGLEPQEIQVGILKRLRGTPIGRHDEAWEMRYSPLPPYEVLQTKLLDFTTMQRLRRFTRYWDLVANSGRFRSTAPLLWAGKSPFAGFRAFSDWLYAQVGRTHDLALPRVTALIGEYLDSDAGRAALAADEQARQGCRPQRTGTARQARHREAP